MKRKHMIVVLCSATSLAGVLVFARPAQLPPRSFGLGPSATAPRLLPTLASLTQTDRSGRAGAGPVTQQEQDVKPTPPPPASVPPHVIYDLLFRQVVAVNKKAEELE